MRAALSSAWSSDVDLDTGREIKSIGARGYFGSGRAVLGEERKDAREVTWTGVRSLTLHLSCI